MTTAEIETTLAEALARHRAGDLAAAEAGYRAVLARDPGQPDARHLLGLIAEARGDSDAAEAHIRRALDARPDEAVFHYNLANVLRASGRHGEAIAAYRRAQALRPDDPDTLLNLGAVLAGHGDPAAAIEVCRALLALAPGHVAALLNLAQAEHALGHAHAARAAWREALTHDPGAVDAHLGLGVLAQEDGDLAAIGHYQAALALDPERADAWNNLGTWHQERGERGAAQDCYRRALAIDPGDAGAHNNLGTLLAASDHLADAERHYRTAIALRPALAEAHKNLGAVLAATGRVDEACASFAEAVRLDPRLSEAAFKLAALRGTTPASAPVDYVAALFDDYAADYDRHLTESLQYRVPERLAAWLDELGLPSSLAIVDLGCGTGLSGAALSARARELVGIDLAPRMLERARARGIYSRLIEGDLVQVLGRESGRFDLAVAADVFVYLGDLAPLAAALTRVLRPGGGLAFSVESAAAAGFRLQATGRYAHAPAYIETVFGAHGFGAPRRQELVLRVEQGRPVAGMLWFWRRR